MPIYKNHEQDTSKPPRFEKTYSEILSSVPPGGALQVLTPLEQYSARQRRWYRGICLPGLSHWSGDTISYWDELLKRECHGIDFLKMEHWTLANGTVLARLTIKGVGKKKMMLFMEEILDKSKEKGWPITAPDPDLRKE